MAGLYDLEVDLYERTNLLPAPACAGILKETATRMWRQVHETGDLGLIHSHHGLFRYAPVGPATG